MWACFAHGLKSRRIAFQLPPSRFLIEPTRPRPRPLPFGYRSPTIPPRRSRQDRPPTGARHDPALDTWRKCPLTPCFGTFSFLGRERSLLPAAASTGQPKTFAASARATDTYVASPDRACRYRHPFCAVKRDGAVRKDHKSRECHRPSHPREDRSHVESSRYE